MPKVGRFFQTRCILLVTKSRQHRWQQQSRRSCYLHINSTSYLYSSSISSIYWSKTSALMFIW